MKADRKYNLYIPRGANTKHEWVKGFSKHEFKDALAGYIVFIATSVVYYIITDNQLISMIIALVGIGGTTIFVSKDDNDQSALDYLRYITSFYKNQKFYPYKQLDEYMDKGDEI